MSSNDRSKPSVNLERRRFFATVGAAAGGIALAGVVAREAQAADLAPLLETDSLAVSMGYKSDATKVDTKKHANYKAGQTCSNCQFFQGDAKAASGPCQLFPGKAVSSHGWCQVWAQKK